MTDLPVIDFSSWERGSPETRSDIAGELLLAWMTHGYCYLVNHGVPPDVMARARRAIESFFRSPWSQKREVHVTKQLNHRGFIDVRDTANRECDERRFFECFVLSAETPENNRDYQTGRMFSGPNVWPRYLPEFRESVYTFYEHMSSLSEQLFELLAIGLNVSPTRFRSMRRKPLSMMCANYYPGVGEVTEKVAAGMGSHTDCEAFTILWQCEVGGFEAAQANGRWARVEPLPDSLIVYPGETVEHWTGGEYPALLHRVVNRLSQNRYSIAYFGNVDYETVIEPLEPCDTNHEPFVSGEILEQKLSRFYRY